MYEREVERFILNAHPRMSGRAVRLRAMLPSEVDQANKDAATVSSLGQPIDFRHAQLRIGVARCLMGITRARVPMKEMPVSPGRDGKPKMRPAVDVDGRTERDEGGTVVMEPVTAPQPDAEWLADEKNWVVPNPMGLEMVGAYDQLIGNAKDDAWLGSWWSETHEVNVGTVTAIMEKGQKVSSG